MKVLSSNIFTGQTDLRESINPLVDVIVEDGVVRKEAIAYICDKANIHCDENDVAKTIELQSKSNFKDPAVKDLIAVCGKSVDTKEFQVLLVLYNAVHSEYLVTQKDVNEFESEFHKAIYNLHLEGEAITRKGYKEHSQATHNYCLVQALKLLNELF